MNKAIANLDIERFKKLNTKIVINPTNTLPYKMYYKGVALVSHPFKK